MKKILTLLSVGATVSSLIATTPVVMAASKTTTKQNNKPAFAQKQGRPMQRGAHGPQQFMLDSQAKLLGITSEDLKSRLSSGKTFDQILADLGISQDQWKAKLEAEHATRVAEMKTKIAADVASGKLTQEQADKILEHLNNPPQNHPEEFPGGHGEDQAKLLGITSEDLKSRLSSGKTFDQILADLGISQDQWKAKLEANREAHLAEMKTKIAADVAAGKLTQAQADKLIERSNEPHKHGDFNGHRFGQKPQAQK